MADTTLYPDADAQVLETLPDFNAGDLDYLMVYATIDFIRRSFLRFDLSGLPATAIISLATLRLNCYDIINLVAGVTDIQARRVADDSWNEVDPDGITWNNQPAHGDVEDTVVPAVGWVEWDITDFVQDEWADDKIVSILLRSVNEQYDDVARYAYFRSKEYNGDDPELYIEYTVPPVEKSVSGSIVVAGNVLVNKTFTLLGSVVGSGAFGPGDKDLIIPGQVTALGTLLRDKELTIQGITTLLGTVLGDKTFTIQGIIDALGAIVVNKSVLAEGLVTALGTALRNKDLTVEGLVTLLGTVGVCVPVDVAGIIIATGTLLRDKELTVQGLTELLGTVDILGFVDVSGNIILSGTALVNKEFTLSGLTTATGTFIRDKELIIQGLTELLGVAVRDKYLTFSGIIDALGEMLVNKSITAQGLVDALGTLEIVITFVGLLLGIAELQQITAVTQFYEITGEKEISSLITAVPQVLEIGGDAEALTITGEAEIIVWR